MSASSANTTPSKRGETHVKDDLQRRAALHALRMGTRFIKTRSWEKASMWLGQAVQLLPEYFEAYFLQGNVYMEMGRVDEAINAYDRAIQLRPDDTNTHLKLGLAYIAKNNWNAALGQYNTLRTMNEVVASELFDKIIYSFNYEMFESLYNKIP